MYIDGNGKTENSPDSYNSSLVETPNNTLTLVRSVISKKRLKNKSTIAMDQEIIRNSTKSNKNGNLNINSIRNKFEQLKETVLKYIDLF